MNQLQALPMNEGFRWKKKLWSEHASAVREAIVGSLGQSAPQRVAGVIRSHSSDHWGVNRRRLARSVSMARGAEADDSSWCGSTDMTALAFALIIGTAERLRFGKQIGRYIGLIPCEDSSAGHQRL